MFREQQSQYYIQVSFTTLLTADLDKLNLVKMRSGGLVFGSSKFPLLPKLPQKMIIALKVVKIDSKIIISLIK